MPFDDGEHEQALAFDTVDDSVLPDQDCANRFVRKLGHDASSERLRRRFLGTNDEPIYPA